MKKLLLLLSLIFIAACSENYESYLECSKEETKECATDYCAASAIAWCKDDERQWIKKPKCEAWLADLKGYSSESRRSETKSKYKDNGCVEITGLIQGNVLPIKE